MWRWYTQTPSARSQSQATATHGTWFVGTDWQRAFHAIIHGCFTSGVCIRVRPSAKNVAVAPATCSGLCVGWAGRDIRRAGTTCTARAV